MDVRTGQTCRVRTFKGLEADMICGTVGDSVFGMMTNVNPTFGQSRDNIQASRKACCIGINNHLRISA